MKKVIESFDSFFAGLKAEDEWRAWELYKKYVKAKSAKKKPKARSKEVKK